MSILDDPKIATREFVLCALYNNSQPLGMGFFGAIGAKQFLSDQDAREELEDRLKDRGRVTGPVYFDYLFGRPLKVEIPAMNGEVSAMDFRLYERDNGSAERAFERELERRTR